MNLYNSELYITDPNFRTAKQITLSIGILLLCNALLFLSGILPQGGHDGLSFSTLILLFLELVNLLVLYVYLGNFEMRAARGLILANMLAVIALSLANIFTDLSFFIDFISSIQFLPYFIIVCYFNIGLLLIINKKRDIVGGQRGVGISILICLVFKVFLLVEFKDQSMNLSNLHLGVQLLPYLVALLTPIMLWQMYGKAQQHNNSIIEMEDDELRTLRAVIKKQRAHEEQDKRTLGI